MNQESNASERNKPDVYSFIANRVYKIDEVFTTGSGQQLKVVDCEQIERKIYEVWVKPHGH